MLMHCDRCAAVVNAEERGNYARRDGDQREQFILASCPRCLSPFLGRALEIGEDEYGNTGWTDASQIFPAAEGVNALYPAGLRTAFSEALACYRGKAFTATAIMCRKAMEGLAHSHGVKERSLVGALRELQRRNVIEGRLVDWADALRFAGNEAAHDVEVTVSAEDAKDLVDFTRALLDYVYTFRARFDAFVSRRNQRNGEDLNPQ